MTKFLFKIRSFTLKIFLIFLSFFVKKNDKNILFANGNGNFSDNSKYLFLYMLDKKFDMFYIVEDKKEYLKLKEQYPVVYKWDIKTLFLVLKVNIVVFTHGPNDIYPALPKRVKKLNLWHGTPIKKIGLDSIYDKKWIEKKQKLGIKLPYEQIDVLTVGSDKAIQYFKSSMNLLENKILSSGLARNDYLFKYKNDNEYILEIKNKILNSSKKVILYAPTFRDEYSKTIENRVFNLLSFLNSEYNKDYIVILKLHPKEINKFYIDFNSLKNIINFSATNIDIEELMLITDVLITDYSSLIYDYSILERPVILYAYDLEEYQSKRGGFYIDYRKEFKDYAICKTLNELKLSMINLNRYTANGYYKIWNKNNACETIYNKLVKMI